MVVTSKAFEPATVWRMTQPITSYKVKRSVAASILQHSSVVVSRKAKAFTTQVLPLPLLFMPLLVATGLQNPVRTLHGYRA